MENARSLLNLYFRTLSSRLRAGQDVSEDDLTDQWPQGYNHETSNYFIKKCHLYYSIAYPDVYKRVFGKTYTPSDVELMNKDYFRELKKTNAANEKAFRQAMRSVLKNSPAKKAGGNFPA
jgi:hypothetical protein